LKITFEDGNRRKGDKIILVDGHKITIQELADEAVGCMNFREYEGIEPMEFFSFLNECIDAQEVTDKIMFMTGLVQRFLMQKPLSSCIFIIKRDLKEDVRPVY